MILSSWEPTPLYAKPPLQPTQLCCLISPESFRDDDTMAYVQLTQPTMVTHSALFCKLQDKTLYNQPAALLPPSLTCLATFISHSTLTAGFNLAKTLITGFLVSTGAVAMVQHHHPAQTPSF